jgi:hypothetical protein
MTMNVYDWSKHDSNFRKVLVSVIEDVILHRYSKDGIKNNSKEKSCPK